MRVGWRRHDDDDKKVRVGILATYFTRIRVMAEEGGGGGGSADGGGSSAAASSLLPVAPQLASEILRGKLLKEV